MLGSKKNILSRPEYFKVGNWLQKKAQIFKEAKTPASEIAKQAASEFQFNVTDQNIKRIAKELGVVIVTPEQRQSSFVSRCWIRINEIAYQVEQLQKENATLKAEVTELRSYVKD